MSEDARPIVFVVDDDLSIREGLKSLLGSIGLSVETFASAQEFSSRPRPDAPACVVLDVRLPGLSGLDLQRELARTGAPIPIVFLTGHGDVPMSVQAMKAGAVEFLTKPFQEAIERDRVDRHRRAERGELRRHYDALTPREREVMALVVSGLLNKQIGAELGTSEITVKVHRAQVMKKMHADSLAELVKISERLA